MRSLTRKLTLAFLVVGLVGVALVAVVVRLQTVREFDRFVVDRYRSEIVEQAGEYYSTNNGWAGVENLFHRGRGPGGFDEPALLLDTSGQVLAGDGPGVRGGEMRVSAIDGETTVPVTVEDQIVGYIEFLRIPIARDLRESAEAAFLDRISRAILFSALAAGVLALLLGAALARTISRPVRELTEGTKALAAGDLGHQGPVRTSDEIGELARSFNQMSADLAQSNQLRRQMTADIAHDLRTPLSVILGYSEALQDGKLPPTPETYGAMHRQAQHLNRLIDDLRTLSLADAGQLSLERRTVSARDLLEHTALAYLPQAEERGITLAVEAGDVPPVWVDPDRLVQVIGNLVANALRHTPDGGRITLSAGRDGERVRLSVADSGPGIPPDDLPHIFERFYRGDKSRADDGSSGLGLAIARSIVEAHGGQIAAENGPQGGAQITLSLPSVAGRSGKNPGRQPAGDPSIPAAT